MNLEIDDRVAIVTGASAGIGHAVALELASNGSRVAMVARNEKQLKQAAHEIRERTSVDILTIPTDVGKPEAAGEIVTKAIDHFGRVDILINNAGRAQAGGLLVATEEDWAEMIELKLHAMRRLCRAAIPEMRKRKWGRIVNMTSIGAIYPNPKLMVSHALSAAISNLTRSLALEFANDGVLVNAIGIGAVLTENWARNMTPSVRKERAEFSALTDEEIVARLGAERTPVGRFGAPEEIAAIAAFLVSNRNGFVTGDTIEASGGADRFM
jgi:3-oxoacyl-[acyl-carrier protein] reductase